MLIVAGLQGREGSLYLRLLPILHPTATGIQRAVNRQGLTMAHLYHGALICMRSMVLCVS